MNCGAKKNQQNFDLAVTTKYFRVQINTRPHGTIKLFCPLIGKIVNYEIKQVLQRLDTHEWDYILISCLSLIYIYFNLSSKLKQAVYGSNSRSLTVKI